MAKASGDALSRAGSEQTYLRQRDGVWHYRRRVPQDLAELDTRGEIRLTTGARDHATAVVIASRINGELEAHWRLLAEAACYGGTVDNVASRFDAAVRAARRLGLSYRPAAELAQVSLNDVIARIEFLEQHRATGNALIVAAVLGGAGKPKLTLSQMFAAYEKLAGDRLIRARPIRTSATSRR